MRLLKKILRIIAIILPVICCVFISNGRSFAKQYSVNSFLANGLDTYSGDSRILIAEGPSLHFSSFGDSSSLDNLLLDHSLKPRNNSYIISHLQNNECRFESYNSPGYSINQNSIDFSLRSYFANSSIVLDRIPSDSDFICNTYRKFGTSPIPSFNGNGVPIDKLLYVQTYNDKGYNFLYSQYSFSGVRTSNGVEYRNNFKLYDLFKSTSDDPQMNDFDSVINQVDSFNFPLNFDSSVENLSSDESVIVYGTVRTYTTVRPTVKLYGRFVSGSSTYNTYSTCSVAQLSDTEFPSIYFSCSLTPNQSIQKGNYGFNLEFSGSNFNQYEFEEFFIRLNGDYSPGGNGSFDNVGSLPNVAPGMPDTPSDYDYSDSLINLFNFNILNPFQSIFNMFTYSDSCSHIPIIAGMLHATDDTYCPWFPATVRQLLTPVISISATMLLFGFFVSFLKSSSGNDTIDAGGHGSIFRGRLK